MKTQNRVSFLMAVFSLTMLFAVAGRSADLTTTDCRLVFSSANSCEKIRITSSGVQWTEAWPNGAWEPAEEFLGYVFLKTVQHEGNTLKVLVGVTKNGAIASVHVKGSNGIAEEFLAQFRGKKLTSNFDLAQTSEDLLSVPTPLQAMHGKRALSASLASSVKEIMQAAAQVLN